MSLLSIFHQMIFEFKYFETLKYFQQDNSRILEDFGSKIVFFQTNISLNIQQRHLLVRILNISIFKISQQNHNFFQKKCVSVYKFPPQIQIHLQLGVFKNFLWMFFFFFLFLATLTTHKAKQAVQGRKSQRGKIFCGLARK